MPIVVSGGTDTTVNDLVEETRRHLHGSTRHEMNKLSASIVSTDTTAVMIYELKGLTQGSYIAIDDEILYVWEVDAATKTVTLQRGLLGSLAADHSSNTLVEVNPRWPRFSIKTALKQEIQGWPASLFAAAYIDIAITSNTRGYDLTEIAADWYYPLEVSISPPLGSLAEDWGRPEVRFGRGFDDEDFSAGSAVFLRNYYDMGRTLRVVYARPFVLDTWLNGTSIISTVGVPASAIDIPPIGAAAKLLATREIIRTDSSAQGESRRAEEVPAGFMSQTANNLMKMRDARLSTEAAKLRGRWPIRY